MSASTSRLPAGTRRWSVTPTSSTPRGSATCSTTATATARPASAWPYWKAIERGAPAPSPLEDAEDRGAPRVAHPLAQRRFQTEDETQHAVDASARHAMGAGDVRP